MQGSVRCPHCYSSFRPRRFHLTLLIQESLSSLGNGPLRLKQVTVKGGKKTVRIQAALEPRGELKGGKVLKHENRYGAEPAIYWDKRFLTDKRKQILELLRKEQPLTARALCKRLSCSNGLITNMSRLGMIRSSRTGYRLPGP